ncbi:AAA family ATPase [Acidianus manzaensis]|uniref:ATPase AAA-type core domain-containing protein n=1 Tax=Acidianus manzaensis TaxID=282676 RepID=A0A1W6K2V5_9CREN|nr:AAA family ATPase [Acidianus manzaensis]ARM76817.1 hypothetical protein B6F84_12840 [Acidianus manzaensis]
MKFEVKKVGPIEDVHLEFGDKVVIVGPNSSGKTILSSLFYFVISPFGPPFSSLPPLSGEVNFDENKVEINIQKIVEDNKERIIKVLKSNLEKIVDPSVFGDNSEISTDKYTLKLGSNEIEVKQDSFSLEITKDKDNISLFISKDITIHVKGNITEIKSMFISVLVERFFSTEWYPSVYLSAERMALPSLLPLINFSVFSPNPIKPLKSLILDPLRWVYSGEFDVLGHKVVISRDLTNQLRFDVFKDNKNIGTAVSSGVYQYSLVKAFSNHPSIKGLIIEEPEINLHSDAQIKVGKEIAKFNKKLFITTHSVWIPVVLGYLLREKVKIYEIVKGVAEERKVYENGLLENLETILPIENETIEEMLNGNFEESSNATNNSE